MGAFDVRYVDLREIARRNWWLLLLRGSIILVVGVFAFVQPAPTVRVLIQVAGTYLVIDSLLVMAAAILGRRGSQRWWVIFLRALLGITAGVAIIMLPSLVVRISTIVLALVFAIPALISGVIDMITAVRIRKQIDNEWSVFLGGLLSVTIGGLILLAPVIFGILLMRILALVAVIAGIVMIYLAFQLRRL